MEANVYLAVNTKHSLMASPHQKEITVLFQVFYYYIFSQPKKKKKFCYINLLLHYCYIDVFRVCGDSGSSHYS